MLVLSRRIGERIVIDKDVVVEVLDIRGNRISLGIQAPPGSRVLRAELVLHEKEGDARTPAVGEYAPTH